MNTNPKENVVIPPILLVIPFFADITCNIENEIICFQVLRFKKLCVHLLARFFSPMEGYIVFLEKVAFLTNHMPVKRAI
jgi:hypothetical protein